MQIGQFWEDDTGLWTFNIPEVLATGSLELHMRICFLASRPQAAVERVDAYVS